MSKITMINLRHTIKRFLIKNKLWRYVEPITLRLRGISDKKIINDLAKMYSGLIKPGDLCFDIGANVGRYSMAFYLLGARVVAVEPQLKLVQEIKKRFGSEIDIVQKGVAEKEDKRRFYVCDEATSISTFLEDHKESVELKGFKDYHWSDGGEIDVTTLDKLVSEYGLPKYCKIDVEGFEYKVLMGLTKPIPYISIEVGWVEGEVEKCRALLLSKGYIQYDFLDSKDLFFKLKSANKV